MPPLVLLVVIAVALSPSAEVTAAADKVDVCHVTNVPNEGNGHIINIADPAWPAPDNGDGTCHVETAPVAPVAVDDSASAPVNTYTEGPNQCSEDYTPVTIDVLANESYSDPVFVSVQTFPQQGCLGIAGVGIFEYTPNAGFVGTDSFTYQICDTDGQCDTATVTINVID
jgi:hypothetical protein